MFDDSMSFIMRNLHEVQAGRGVNAPGTPEIPQAVFNVARATVKRAISRLREKGTVHRIGGKKGGYWEVLDR